VKFIDRMVADSRMVALNHTAGLSLPSQIQMMLFSSFTLLDKSDSYKNLCQLICRRRWHALFDGLGLTLPADSNRAFYYVELRFDGGPGRVSGRISPGSSGRITSALMCSSGWPSIAGSCSCLAAASVDPNGPSACRSPILPRRLIRESGSISAKLRKPT